MANKFLGIGANMQPGLYSQANTLAERSGKIRHIDKLVKQNLRNTLEQARDIGIELVAAKDQCLTEHASWEDWLKTTGLAERTAQKYMRIAKYWD